VLKRRINKRDAMFTWPID